MNDLQNRRSRVATTDYLPLARLDAIVKERAQEYATAEPFPHIVLDNLFDPRMLELVLQEFPKPEERNWIEHDNAEEVKLESKDELDIPPFTRQFLYALNSSTFIRFLERLTGIEKLIGDPHFEGGGLHQMLPGGKLAIHADFSKHPTYHLDRRLNLLVYLNKDWKPEYRGYFELWNAEMSRMVRDVAAIFNRAVIFTTDRYSYHGLPDPILTPSGINRRSIALYYYTNGRAQEGKDGIVRHGTLFQRRPGERVTRTAKQIAKELMPPILWRAISGARKEFRK